MINLFGGLCFLLQLCDLIKSRLDGPEFLERLESAQLSVHQKRPGIVSISISRRMLVFCIMQKNYDVFYMGI